MTLNEIEKALRPQFVWNSEPHKRWQVVSRRPSTEDVGNHIDESTLGMIVFAGISYLNGFKSKEVFDFLEIDRRKHTGYLVQFKKALDQERNSQINELYNDMSDLNKRIIAKTVLVQNALKLSSKDTFLTLADVEF